MSAVERREEGNESIESIPDISVDGQTLHGELEKPCLVRKFHRDNIAMIYQEQRRLNRNIPDGRLRRITIPFMMKKPPAPICVSLLSR